jgi:hypothetical protein
MSTSSKFCILRKPTAVAPPLPAIPQPSALSSPGSLVAGSNFATSVLPAAHAHHYIAPTSLCGSGGFVAATHCNTAPPPEHSTSLTAGSVPTPPQQYGRAITRLSDMRRQQQLAPPPAHGATGVAELTVDAPCESRCTYSSPRGHGSLRGAARGRTSRGSRSPATRPQSRGRRSGGRGTAAKLELRPDGSLYEHRWFTAAGRRVLVYNGTQFKGTTGHKMWKLIQDHNKHHNGLPLTASTQGGESSSSPRQSRGSARGRSGGSSGSRRGSASPPAAIASKDNRVRRVAVAVPTEPRAPPPARNPPIRAPSRRATVAAAAATVTGRTNASSLFVLSQADVSGASRKRQRAASSSDEDIDEDSDDSFIVPDDEVASLSQTPSSSMPSTTSSSDDESGSFSSLPTDLSLPFSQATPAASSSSSTTITDLSKNSVGIASSSCRQHRHEVVVIVSSDDEDVDAMGTVLSHPVKASARVDSSATFHPPPIPSSAVVAQKKHDAPKCLIDDEEDETIFIRAIKREVEESRKLVSLSRSSAVAQPADVSSPTVVTRNQNNNTASGAKRSAAPSFTIVVGRRGAAASGPITPSALAHEGELEAFQPRRAAHHLEGQRSSSPSLTTDLRRYEEPLELPSAIEEDIDLFAGDMSDIMGGYAF